MKNHFDELAKDIARGVSRREALGRFGIGLAAIATGVIFGRGMASSLVQAQSPTPLEIQECQKRARQQATVCERTCGDLRREARAECLAECRAQEEAALRACEEGNGGTCDGGTCEGGFSSCNDSETCFCGTTSEGAGFCFEDAFCADVATCSSSSDCPDGFTCVVNTCCGSGGICLSECGSAPPNGSSRSDGATAAGRSL